MENLVILDIGSNSVRMAINQISNDGSYREIKRIKSDSRLSEGMGKAKILQKDAMERTIKSLADFKRIYLKYNAKKRSLELRRPLFGKPRIRMSF